MNYFIFYCNGAKSFQYLNGTNYVGIWSDTLCDAIETCKRYFTEGITHLETPPKNIVVGFLY